MQPMLIERYTVKDYEQWEGEWELVEGVPYAMAPAPVGKHQWVMMRLGAFLNRELEECRECYVLGDAEWRVSKDTVVRPDVMVTCGDLVDFVSRRPEIVIEIVSPSTKLRDEVMKKELCRREGVPYFALVYPDDEKVRFFKLISDEYREEEPRFEICGKKIELDIDYIFRR